MRTRIDTPQIPYSTEAEVAVLGSLLIDGERIHSVRTWLKAEDFFVLENQLVYLACLKLCDKGEAIDQVTVAKELAAMGKLEEAGGTSLLSGCITNTPTSLHIEYYGRIVKNTGVQRQAISLGSQVEAMGYEETDPAKLVSRIGQSYLKLQSSIAVPQLITPQEWAERGMERYHTLSEGKSVSISTGLEHLDFATGGIFPGEYWILAAAPGMGKTTLAIQITDVLSIFGNVLFCSIEMSEYDILDRRIATLTKEPLRKIRSGKYPEELYGRITEQMGNIAGSNIYYFGQSGSLTNGGGITTDALFSIANYMMLSYGLKAIVVDYLQNLSDIYGKSLHERTTHITRKLQNMARSMNIPIICLCQLNRELFHRDDKRPRMSDLRDSGAIEQDADVLLFLHRESAFCNEEELAKKGLTVDDAELLIAKQRQGDKPNQMIRLTWDGETKKYLEKGERAKGYE